KPSTGKSRLRSRRCSRSGTAGAGLARRFGGGAKGLSTTGASVLSPGTGDGRGADISGSVAPGARAVAGPRGAGIGCVAGGVPRRGLTGGTSPPVHRRPTNKATAPVTNPAPKIEVARRNPARRGGLRRGAGCRRGPGAGRGRGLALIP